MIKNLSHRRQLPRLGIIKKGIRNGDQTREVDYHVCPPEVQEVCGQQPRELKIIFPANEWETVFPHYLKLYGANNAVKCVGDGHKASRMWKYLPDAMKEDTRVPDGGEGAFVDFPCHSNCPDLRMKNGCGPSGILSFMIPDVSLDGVYQIFVHSQHDIIEINSAIAEPTEDTPGGWLRNLFGGRIAGIPLLLTRQKYEVTVDGYRQKHWKLAFKLHPDAIPIALGTGTWQALPAPADQPQPVDVPAEVCVPGDEQPEDTAPTAADDADPAPFWIETADGLQFQEDVTVIRSTIRSLCVNLRKAVKNDEGTQEAKAAVEKYVSKIMAEVYKLFEVEGARDPIMNKSKAKGILDRLAAKRDDLTARLRNAKNAHVAA